MKIQITATKTDDRPTLKIDSLKDQGIDLLIITAGRRYIYVHRPPRLSAIPRKASQLKYRYLLHHRDDNDCDGLSHSVNDRLTGGRLFYYTQWNYSRVGGSWGEYARIMGKRYTPETAPRFIAWLIKAILR